LYTGNDLDILPCAQVVLQLHGTAEVFYPLTRLLNKAVKSGLLSRPNLINHCACWIVHSQKWCRLSCSCQNKCPL